MHKKRMLNRTLAVVLLGLLALSLAVSNQPGSYKADAARSSGVGSGVTPQNKVLVLKVYFRNNAERDSLATELSAEEVSTKDGYLTVWADNDLYASLLRRGLRIEIDDKTTYEANHPNVLFGHHSSPTTFDGGYRTVEEMQAFLDQYVANYPGLAVKVDVGNSWCKDHPGSCTQPNANNGYDMWAMHITNQSIAGPKPVFWYDTGIHSREIATPEIAMRYIAWLLDGYAANPDAHWLVDWNDIWVMPMLNPDGHHIVEAGGSSPFSQRKNANNTNGCTSYPPSSSVQFGTDNNRNYPFKWNCCGGSSTAPCDQTYHGPSAASDPETQYVTAQIRNLIPDQRGPNDGDAAPITATGVIQGMHSNASLNLYPWGWTTAAPPNGPDLANMGAHLSATNAAPAGNGYQSCQPPNCLYAVDGDSADWGYGELGAPAFTTEIEGSSFYPTYSTIDSTIWPRNQGPLIYQAKIARSPYLTTRGPDANSVAASPMTVTQGTPSSLTGNINYAWTANSYAQNVADAEYYIDTPPWAGGIPQAMSGSFSSQTVAVSASIDTTGLVPGRHVIFVRGRGVNDYSGLHSWGEFTAAFLDVLPPAGTATPTFTGTPPTATSTRTPTNTFTVTNTPIPTNTFTPTPTVCTNYGFTTSTGASIAPGTTDIGNHGDDAATTINLPFAYSLYGQSFSAASVNSNGTLQFTGSTTAFSNACLPTTTLNNAIAANWDDLETTSTLTCTGGCGVFTSVSGAVPNRIFNIEWRAVYFSNPAQQANFEIRLYEGQSRFDIVYGIIDQSGTSATVGVQRDTGSQFAQFECNTGSLSSGLQITFTLPPCGTPAPTGSATSTPTSAPPTNTFTPTRTNSPTNTRTFTPTSTFTSTPTDIPTNTPTNTPLPPTSSPTSVVVIVGHVTIQGRPAQPNPRQSVPITLTLKLSGGGPESNYSATTDASGYFTVTAPGPGAYDYRVKNPQTLANAGNAALANGTNAVEMGLLLTGDANNDNCVNVQDFSLLKNTFGKSVGDPGYDARADFNGDTSISVVDFNLQKNNFGICGAGPVR